MTDCLLVSRLGVGLSLLLFVAACGAETSQGESGPGGSLSLQLQLGVRLALLQTDDALLQALRLRLVAQLLVFEALHF